MKRNVLSEKLIDAAMMGDLQDLAALLKKGAEVNALGRSSGQSALMYAASYGHVEVVEALLAAGADPNLAGTDCGFEGWTAMMYAVDTPTGRLVEVLDRLADAGADLDQRNAKGATALYVAADRGDATRDGMQRLLALGADPAIADADGYTVLVLARMRDATALVALLEAADAPTDVLPEATLIAAAEASDLATVTRLLAAGTAVNAVLRNNTALGYAAANGHAEVVAALLAAGADPRIAEPIGGATPLMRAAYRGSGASVRLLLAAGADPLARNEDDLDACAFAKLALADGMASAADAAEVLSLLPPG